MAMSEDWDFKFDDKEGKKKKSPSKQIKKPSSTTSKRELGKKIAKSDDDSFEIPKEKNRKLLLDRAGAKRKLRRDYVEREVEEDDTPKISAGDRQLWATVIDYAPFLVLYLTSNSILKFGVEFLEIKRQLLDDIFLLGPYLIVLVFFLCYNFFFPLLFRRTLGMIIMRQSLLTEEGGPASLLTLWMKEIFVKPFMLVTVISILFMLGTGRDLCDRALGTITTDDI